jgi:hypothetical protein
VTAIGISAFEENQLTSVTIGNGVTDIGDWAFVDNRLTSVTIPANVNITGNSFTGDFADVYIREGKRAGTYKSDDDGRTWTRQQ